jgi:hypothetical protein
MVREVKLLPRAGQRDKIKHIYEKRAGKKEGKKINK